MLFFWAVKVVDFFFQNFDLHRRFSCLFCLVTGLGKSIFSKNFRCETQSHEVGFDIFFARFNFRFILASGLPFYKVLKFVAIAHGIEMRVLFKKCKLRAKNICKRIVFLIFAAFLLFVLQIA